MGWGKICARNPTNFFQRIFEFVAAPPIGIAKICDDQLIAGFQVHVGIIAFIIEIVVGNVEGKGFVRGEILLKVFLGIGFRVVGGGRN